MPQVTPYQNTSGQDCVSVVNDDGTTWSGLKSAYDEMIATQSVTGSTTTLNV